MDRPTCKTCPYWSDEIFHEDPTCEASLCACQRTPPQLNGKPFNVETETGCDFPYTWDSDWCGEHPDFPEYIASLKAKHG